ncbi:STAS/SEC14 domain-containing protein, partial [bacterium]|nr:STAS/SEC14 domain-containing protein [bacterium]
GLTDSDTQIALLKQARELICGQPPASVRSLIDYTGIRYNIPAVEAQKAFSTAVGPHMKASAVVGITGILQVIYRSVVKLTGRKIRTFDDLEAAQDWLAEQ